MASRSCGARKISRRRVAAKNAGTRRANAGTRRARERVPPLREALLDEILEAALRDGADDLTDDAPLLEHEERRQAAHVELGDDLLVRVGVELADSNLSFVGARERLDVRGHRAARRAPGGPEVDEHWYGRLGHEALEVLVGELDDLRGLLFGGGGGCGGGGLGVHGFLFQAAISPGFFLSGLVWLSRLCSSLLPSS